MTVWKSCPRVIQAGKADKKLTPVYKKTWGKKRKQTEWLLESSLSTILHFLSVGGV